MSDEITVPRVYAAIAAVMSDIGKEGIAKDRKNAEQKYTFRGIDDVYNALSPILSRHNLVMLPRILSRTVTERQSRSGGALFNVTVEAEFDLISSEDASKHTIRTFGEAMDSADKATNKAMSAAYKYAAMQAFAIPTEGENDADAETHDVAPVETKSAPASKADSRETYERLSKANRGLTTIAAFEKFWANDKVQSAAKSLPPDWAKSLKAEKGAKYEDLLAESAARAPADDFPGDLPVDHVPAKPNGAAVAPTFHMADDAIPF